MVLFAGKCNMGTPPAGLRRGAARPVRGLPRWVLSHLSFFSVVAAKDDRLAEERRRQHLDTHGRATGTQGESAGPHREHRPKQNGATSRKYSLGNEASATGGQDARPSHFW